MPGLAGRLPSSVHCLQLVPLSLSFLNLRTDILALLLRTYDFWYVATNIMLATVATIISVQDWRSLLIVVICISFVNVLMIDANYSSIRATVPATVVGAVSVLCFAVYVGFEILDGASNVVIFQYKEIRFLETKDVVVNGLFTVLLMMLRNAYRRHGSVTIKTKDAVVVKFVSYRAGFTLEPIGPTLVERYGASIPSSTSPSPLITQLEVVRDGTIYDTRRMLFPSMWKLVLTLPSTFLSALGWLGLGLTVVCLGLDRQLTFKPLISGPALLLSIGYCLLCFTLQNRQLLRRLFVCFDFLFYMAQIFLDHLTLCHLFHWGTETMPILSISLWVFWVLTLDALTPPLKRHLGCSRSLAVVVLLVEALGHVIIIVEFVFGELATVEDRVLINVSLPGDSRHVLRISAVSLLLSRSFTLFWWCCRLLWRLSRVKGAVIHDLIMIQGIAGRDCTLERFVRGARRHAPRGVRRSLLALVGSTVESYNHTDKITVPGQVS